MPLPESSTFPVVFGDLELIDRIGAGGMAEVFSARPNGQADRTVVVKRILPAHRQDSKFQSLLLQEGAIGARLRHRNLVRVLGASRTASGEPYLVMEYVDGIDVKRLAWSHRAQDVEFPAWLAVHIASEVLVGLAHAHGQVDRQRRAAPVLHRDISPENVLVGRRGQVKLSDFGVSTQESEPRELPRGKLPYMAPELFAGQPLDPRSDLFATGVVLWELLTGHHLFRGGSPQEVIAKVCTQPRVPPSRLNPSVPAILDGVVLSALAAKVEQRPSSALAMHASLQRVLELLHPEGLISAEKVAAAVSPHLDAARTPREDMPEQALGDVDEVLGRLEEHQFLEPGDEEDPDGTTYAIIRRADQAADEEPPMGTDELLRAYLQEPPIPARPGLVDTLDLAPDRSPADGAAAVTSSTYDGPYPVWVATPHGQQGPLRPARAFSYLQDQPAEMLGQLRISANGTRWIELGRVAYLLGDELVEPSLELGACEMQGKLNNASVTAVLGTFARREGSNRVVFARTDHGMVDRVEVQIVDGQATAIHDNRAFFTLWCALLGNAYLEEIGLTEALHHTLAEDRRLEPRLSEEVAHAVNQARGLAKRRALEQIFGWKAGEFGSTARVTISRDAAGIDLLRFLPRLVARKHGPDFLRGALAPLLDQRLWRVPEFSAEVDRLQLRGGERLRAEAFGYGRTLFESLEFANSDRKDANYGLVLAYLFVELGLLNQTNPTHVMRSGFDMGFF